jgi:p-methyltransferase
MFFGVDGPAWLPQWSFDFWIIPYLLGKGLAREDILHFTTAANRMLAIDLASLPAAQKTRLEQEALDTLVSGARRWSLVDSARDDSIVATV